MTSLNGNNLGALEGRERLLGTPVTLGWDIQSIRDAEGLGRGDFVDIAVRRQAALVGGARGHAARADVPGGVWAISFTHESIGR